jgi:hypothetical protein
MEVDDLRVLNAKVQCANKAERPDWANFSQLGDFSPYWANHFLWAVFEKQVTFIFRLHFSLGK